MTSSSLISEQLTTIHTYNPELQPALHNIHSAYLASSGSYKLLLSRWWTALSKICRGLGPGYAEFFWEPMFIKWTY